MSPSRPNEGVVHVMQPTTETRTVTERRARPGNRWRNGSWRPNHGWHSNEGVRIVMRHEGGVTKGDVLRVPLRFQTPVLNELQRQYLYQWATFDTLRVGQKSRPQGRQLLQLPINTVLLDGPALDTLSNKAIMYRGIAAPQRLLDELRWIEGYTPGSQPEPFRLVISQPAVWTHPIVNTLATLISVEPTQRPEEVGTEYLSLTFQEYSENEQIGRKQRPQSHGKTRWTLRHGDTLYEIAKKSHWHRPSAWKTIAKANGIKGVSPSSATELAAWAKKHHKKQLVIPAKGRS